MYSLQEIPITPLSLGLSALVSLGGRNLVGNIRQMGAFLDQTGDLDWSEAGFLTGYASGRLVRVSAT